MCGRWNVRACVESAKGRKVCEGLEVEEVKERVRVVRGVEGVEGV